MTAIQCTAIANTGCILHVMNPCMLEAVNIMSGSHLHKLFTNMCCVTQLVWQHRPLYCKDQKCQPKATNKQVAWRLVEYIIVIVRLPWTLWPVNSFFPL